MANIQPHKFIFVFTLISRFFTVSGWQACVYIIQGVSTFRVCSLTTRVYGYCRHHECEGYMQGQTGTRGYTVADLGGGVRGVRPPLPR